LVRTGRQLRGGQCRTTAIEIIEQASDRVDDGQAHERCISETYLEPGNPASPGLPAHYPIVLPGELSQLIGNEAGLVESAAAPSREIHLVKRHDIDGPSFRCGRSDGFRRRA
jgi:hypothetical protein